MFKLLSLFIFAILALTSAGSSSSDHTGQAGSGLLGCFAYQGNRLSIYSNGKAYTDVDRCNIFDWSYNSNTNVLRLTNPSCYVRGPTTPCRDSALRYRVDFVGSKLKLTPLTGSGDCRSAINTSPVFWERTSDCVQACLCSTDCRLLSGCYVSQDNSYLVVRNRELVITRASNPECVRYFYNASRQLITVGREQCDPSCLDDQGTYFCDFRPDSVTLYFHDHFCTHYLGATWIPSTSSSCRSSCDCDENELGEIGDSSSHHSSSHGFPGGAFDSSSHDFPGGAFDSSSHDFPGGAFDSSSDHAGGAFDSSSHHHGPGAGGAFDSSSRHHGPGAGGAFDSSSRHHGPGAGGAFDSSSHGPGAGGAFDSSSRHGPGAGGAFDSSSRH